MPIDQRHWDRVIETRQDFLDAMQDLLADPDFLSGGPAGEENTRSRDFLDAMTAWLEDSDGGEGALKAPSDRHATWGDLFRLMLIGAEYE